MPTSIEAMTGGWKLGLMRKKNLLAYVLCVGSLVFMLWVLVFVTTSRHSIPDVRNVPLTEHRRSAKQDYEGVQDPPVLIPDTKGLDSMTWADLSQLYHRYLSLIQIKCRDIQRVGKITDGGWDVCADSTFAPKSPCVAYSFGIGDDFSFDDAFVQKYACKVYSFDPSMKIGNIKRGENSFFLQQGIADSDRTLPNGWVMSRFDSLRVGLKHTKVHVHTVKLDIEEMEWEVLPDLLASESLKDVTQLLIELHQCDGCSKYDPDQEDKEPPRERYIHILGILSLLYEQGFRIFHHHENTACMYIDKFTNLTRNACVEIGFVKVS